MSASVVAALAVAVPSAGARGGATVASAAPECGAARAAVVASLDALRERHGVPGAAAEVAGGRCGTWQVARGTADLDTGRPMSAGDRLRIGSASKTFTAAVVVQLAAEGRVGLDAPVERYLPGLIRGNGYDGRRITVRQLLQQTSGLPDHVDTIAAEPLAKWRYRHFEPRELVGIALKMPHPRTSPGREWHYSTTNYVLAALLVERVTGHGIETEVTRRIIEPLGLRDTYWPGDETRIRGPHSRSYFTEADAETEADSDAETDRDAEVDAGDAGPAGAGSARLDGTEWNLTFGGAGGALVSTPADVDRFYRALLGGKLVPARWLAQMKRSVPADPDRLWPGARYGLGLISTPLECGGRWWGHGGTVPGGHRALGAVGPDGRSVALALNQVPLTKPGERDFRAVVNTALCAGR
ncbi:serine hydrolase domain-containing protein [Streptomyces luteocolor]|uniref:serine hydrolase domain-containing protein n=1 Tax=Streptomyces luteocolor TaxID=285500 RepID=UPI000853D16A|nr:serine hydrolase domain-containing protein [Streptomyces luteocolor]